MLQRVKESRYYIVLWNSDKISSIFYNRIFTHWTCDGLDPRKRDGHVAIVAVATLLLGVLYMSQVGRVMEIDFLDRKTLAYEQTANINRV